YRTGTAISKWVAVSAAKIPAANAAVRIGRAIERFCPGICSIVSSLSCGYLSAPECQTIIEFPTSPRKFGLNFSKADISKCNHHGCYPPKADMCDAKTALPTANIPGPEKLILPTGFRPKSHRVRPCLLPLLCHLHVNPKRICHLRG